MTNASQKDSTPDFCKLKYLSLTHENVYFIFYDSLKYTQLQTRTPPDMLEKKIVSTTIPW